MSPAAARPPVLRETNSARDVEALDRAWAAEPTFAYLPEKTAVDEDWVRASLGGLPAEMRSGHFALLTSGSTGLPKLVIGERRRAERLADLLHVEQASDAVRATVLALPLSYCYAFVNQWLWARRTERELVWTAGLGDPARFDAALAGAEEAMLCLVGAQLPLLESQLPGRVHEGVVRVHFAGGPFPQAGLGALARRFPRARVFNNYGCAEAMPRLTLRRAEDSPHATHVGRPLPGVRLDLGPAGELRFQSPFGAVAFQTAEGLHVIGEDEWLPTGDLARRAEDGGWELLGRANQVFKRFGEKISLAHLAETVAAGGWSGEAQFYREADRLGEEGFVLLLAPAPDQVQLRAVLGAFRARHPRTHWPLRVESLAALPRLSNGKPDLAALASAEGKLVHWRNRI